MYLTGSTHYLTRVRADELAAASDLKCEIRQDCDGTFSVYFLSEEPVQSGQAQWIETTTSK